MNRAFLFRYALGGIGLLMAGSLILGLFAAFGGKAVATDIFHFISLLIIFMTALAATAFVFTGLGMSNSKEAFGLPTGSVRALIAIGIMILVVVFGVPMVSQSSDLPTRLADAPVTSLTVPRSDLSTAIAQHEAQGLAVVVTDYGRNPGSGGATDAGAPAKIAIYERVHSRSAQDFDIAKQLLTAILTLLTTVVGFYFGAQSVSEGVKHGESAAAAAASAAPAEDLAARREQLAAALAKLKSDAAATSSRLDTASAAAQASGDQARKAAASEAAKLKAQVDKDVGEIETALSAADEALKRAASATSQTGRAEAQSAAKQQFDEAASALAAGQKQQQDYDKAVGELQ
jgi:hypothetical protein